MRCLGNLTCLLQQYLSAFGNVGLPLLLSPFASQVQLLNAIDAVCSHPELLIEHYVPVLSHLLPALSAAGELLGRVHAAVSLQVEAPLVHCKPAHLKYQNRYSAC